MHLCLLGFLGWVVPDPVNVGATVPYSGGALLVLVGWVLPTPPVTSVFILSIIASMLALFVAVAAMICQACCSCSIANNIACDLLLSSAAAVSCARSAASLKRDCLAVVGEYWLHSSHFLVKYVWSLAHVCCAAVLFSHATI